MFASFKVACSFKGVRAYQDIRICRNKSGFSLQFQDTFCVCVCTYTVNAHVQIVNETGSN